MTDRITDIWGARTPHARGTAWPTRVDQHLDAGVEESQVDRWVQSACVLCSNGCGVDIAVQDGRMVGVRGRLLAEMSEGHRTALAPVVERYGEDDVEEPERLHAEVLDVATTSTAGTSRQLSWLNTRMKVAAPQALIVAP